MGGVDVFRFDNVSGYGRGLASSCACEDQLGGLGVFYGFMWAGFRVERKNRIIII